MSVKKLICRIFNKVTVQLPHYLKKKKRIQGLRDDPRAGTMATEVGSPRGLFYMDSTETPSLPGPSPPGRHRSATRCSKSRNCSGVLGM